MNTQIILNNVSKTIKGRRVLDHINLTLDAGKTYCFCGRNGSGKTMLLRAIAGLIGVEGKIIVFGKDITADHSFPDNVGLIIEKTEMWPQFTGLENLGLLAEIRGVITKDDCVRALERVGLDPEDSRLVRTYSLGMKQKLAIAQAIMEKPSLLLLDEPTNGLDDDAVLRFRKIMEEEKSRGCTILLATHQLEDLNGLVDKTYRISEGRCREDSPKNSAAIQEKKPV